MSVIHDEEFGNITLRRSARATQVRVRVAPDGTLRASLPMYAPTLLVKRLIKGSRNELRELLFESRPKTVYENGMQIGKSHTLIVQAYGGETHNVIRHGQQIIVKLPSTATLNDSRVVNSIRDVVIAALRVEAKSYLPKRLAFLATKHGFQYEKLRFSHAGGRWGSCSTTGTISLNIALMKLPFELIDYVLLHELSHTKQMNHSPSFWLLVESADPQFKIHKRALKLESPSI
ncbi:MAG TPA: SprT family zinc-dependent metalloprotease [Candidatus Saccharimonadales bacterium]|nr:SprT family zinc-dependent metalloprotease [Candidatus Saccharimonadales bacterium]